MNERFGLAGLSFVAALNVVGCGDSKPELVDAGVADASPSEPSIAKVREITSQQEKFRYNTSMMTQFLLSCEDVSDSISQFKDTALLDDCRGEKPLLNLAKVDLVLCQKAVALYDAMIEDKTLDPLAVTTLTIQDPHHHGSLPVRIQWIRDFVRDESKLLTMILPPCDKAAK